MPGNSRGTDLVTGTSGILFAALMIVFLFTISSPAISDPVAEWNEYVQDGGRRTGAIVTGYLVALAGLVFVALCAALRQRLVEGDPVNQQLARVGMALAIAAGGAIAIGAAALAAAPFSVEISDGTTPAGEIALLMDSLGVITVVVPGGLAAAGAVGVLSVALWREQAAARWLLYFSMVIVVLLVAGAALLPWAIVSPNVLGLWALAVGIEALLRARRVESAQFAGQRASEPT